MQINLNQYVTFKLTSHGVAVGNDYLKQTNPRLPARSRTPLYSVGQEVTMPLWSAIQRFGSGVALGNDAFCEGGFMEVKEG